MRGGEGGLDSIDSFHSGEGGSGGELEVDCDKMNAIKRIEN